MLPSRQAAFPSAQDAFPATPPARRPVYGRRTPAAPSPEAPTRFLALDIETVPDDLVPADWPADKFPKNAWHRIVAISFVEADILRDEVSGLEEYRVTACRSGGAGDWDEGRLLRAFWRFFEDGDYRVCSWNGRAFDMPTLAARSMMHGVSAGAWYRRGTRWAGYTHRYAIDWHVDLMDAMSEFGVAARLTLEEAAGLLGLPGKMGEHGSQVATLVAEGRMERVRDYCETDCLNLAVLYFRWAYLTGRTDAAAHDRAVGSLLAYLERERAERPHLGRFLDGWRGAADRRPLFVAPT